jgi:hypothetical protein
MDSVDTTSTDTQPTPFLRKRTKLFILSGVFVCIIGSIVGLTYNLNQPANGIVTSPAQAAAKKKSTFNTVTGKAVSFQYPTTIQSQKPENLSVGDVEKFMFGQVSRRAWQLAIQIKRIPSGLLADESGYNYRLQNPGQFEEQISEINGMTVRTMVDKTKTGDKVAFLTHQGLVATVALSGAESVDADSEAAWGVLLNSWQWL